MDVPMMLGVNVGYAATVLGGLLLFAVAAWWTLASDGIEVPRESWPAAVRGAAVAGWALFAGGLAVQLAAYLAQLGAARWPGGFGGH